ncbi:unnamed protein product [Oppiella nova]|uniref:Nbr1 FW domain-containing protein n=1 Tax=Oppiella nova TaxID=334625 RepID=A0A7R9LEH1_9ACAR|nr:unnamed protein product [Oppiella nova]CAG2162706.1 unnamed protein product [Oppiella nova]
MPSPRDMDVDTNNDCGGGDQQQQPPPPPHGSGGGPPDLTAELLQRFSCMNTTDRDVLVDQLKRLLGEHVNDDSAHFWLDMNNWYDTTVPLPPTPRGIPVHCVNLQAAICSYFDYEQPALRLPSMKLVNDVTIGEGEEVPPNAKFTKTWRIANSGEEPWPTGCCLRFTDGDQMCHNERVLVDPLAPGDYTDIAVDMISPQKSGIYTGQWRMSTPTGQFFGEIIWVIITVSEGGLLAVTQQLSGFNELGAASLPVGAGMLNGPAVHVNPFANQLQTHLANNRLHFETHNTITNNNNNNNQNSQQFSDESMPNSDDNGWG